MIPVRNWLLGILIIPLWSSVAFSAAITDISISRSISADAQAGGNTLEAISGSSTGVFNETRTDTDSSGNRSARVTSFQNTTVLTDADYIELTGAAYARSAADGGAVQAIGSSKADIYFTVDRGAYYTMTGTFVSSPQIPNIAIAGSAVAIYRITANGEQVFAGLFPSTVQPSPSASGSLQPGRYHFSIDVIAELSFPEFAPMANDITGSLYDIRFTLIPEQSVMPLMLVGLTAVTVRRRR